jgi:hypothetical protein
MVITTASAARELPRRDLATVTLSDLEPVPLAVVWRAADAGPLVRDLVAAVHRRVRPRRAVAAVAAA